jgi:LysM repeat protein
MMYRSTDVLAIFELTIDQFYSYNPAVLADCSGLWPDMAYCIRAQDYTSPGSTMTGTPTSTLPPTSSVTGAPGPTHTGQPEDCNQWHVVVDGDTCSTVATEAAISVAQFLDWNPAVSADCQENFWLGSAYCVGTTASSSPTTTTTTPPGTTTTTTSTSAGAPGPTHTGQPSNCNQWHVVVDGDTCATVSSQAGLPLTQFLAWNPAVSADCQQNFWLRSAYYVGLGAPAPAQEGNAVAGCTQFAQAQDGDGCWVFADRNGVALADLYAWNSVLGSDGSGCATSFWATYWYCVAAVVA